MLEINTSPPKGLVYQEILKEGTSPGIVFVPSIVRTPENYVEAFSMSSRQVVGLNIDSYGELLENREAELDKIAESIKREHRIGKLLSFSSGAGICLDLAERLNLNGNEVVLIAPVILNYRSMSFLELLMSGTHISDERAIKIIKSSPFHVIAELAELIETGGRLTQKQKEVWKVVLEVIKVDLGPRLIPLLDKVKPKVFAGKFDRISRMPMRYDMVKFNGGHSMDDAIRSVGEAIIN